MENSDATLDKAMAFHGQIAAIVSAVQAGIWQGGREELIGYDSDFGFGQKRGVQTLVLKTTHRSAYLRLDWDTLTGTSPADRQRIEAAVQGAILTLT